MDPFSTLGALAALGFLAGICLVALLTVRRSRGGSITGLPGSSSRRIAVRVAELSAAPARDQPVAVPAGAAGVPIGPRRRLWRDTSAALVVLGALVLVVVVADPIRPGPSAAILGATGRPASSQASVDAVSSRSSTPPATSASPADEPTGPSAEPTRSSDPVASRLPATPRATASRDGPRATSDRFAVLTPCPDRPDCYVYVVRRGDNLTSIANWFGIPFATVLRFNPQIADPRFVHAGDRIALPPPRR